VVEANGDTVTWAYDNTYQLTNEKRSGTNSYNVTYLYDSAGNRLRKTDSGTITTSSYDSANQLIKQNAAGAITSYIFDANANQQRITTNVVTTYSWDFENRLTKIRPSNLLPAINTMIYDGDGKRVSKEDSAGKVKHIWDGANILEETDQNDVTQAIYTGFPASYGNLISQVRGSTSTFFLFESLGSTEQLTDATGQTVTDSFIYRAFGDLQSSSATTVSPFRYIGEREYYLDLDFLLYYLRARIYNPVIGRFLSLDPLWPNGEYMLHQHLFGYAKNNSVNLVDPSGRQALKAGPPFFFEEPKQKCTPAEEQCIKQAFELAENLLKKRNDCFTQVLRKCLSTCTSKELTDCILRALQNTKYTCADKGVGKCHNSAHTDTQCGILKSQAALGEVWPISGWGPPDRCPVCKHPLAFANNCAFCDQEGYGQIRTWLCRKRKEGGFGGGIDEYCRRPAGIQTLAQLLVHEASHSCVGGHDTTRGKGNCDRCLRPDATDIGEAFMDCLNKK
jgi:RHS repeat-associated protein